MRICFLRRDYNPHLFHECDLPNYTIYQICYIIYSNMSNTTGATCGAETAYLSGAHEITPSFWWCSCCLFFSFISCVMCTIVCLSICFFFFIFTHGVVSLFSIYEFVCTSGIFRPSFVQLGTF